MSDHHPSPANPPRLRRRHVLAGAAAIGGALTLPTWVASAAPDRRTIVLASDSEPNNYAIVVGADEGPVVAEAARELVAHLKQLSGATFPVVTPDEVTEGIRVIALGRLNPWATTRATATQDPLPPEDAERDGFSLRTSLGDILIAGVSPRGTLYGTYWVLDRLFGIRWFAPDTTVVPARAGEVLRINESAFVGDHHARFDYREFFTSDGVRQYAWRHRNLQNGRRGYETRDRGVDPVAGLDTWSTIWPGINPGQFKEIVTDRTLWHSGQLLFMDPRTRTAATVGLTSRIQQRIESNGDASHPFHMNDGPYDQPDAASASFAADHGDALSAPMLDMVNEVARRLKAQIPRARVETQAYLWALQPPTGIRVEDNVVISTAPIFADFGAPMFGAGNARASTMMDGWAGIADHMVMWDYHYVTMDYLLPLPDWWAHTETVKQMATRPSYVGYFAECMFTDASHGIAFKALKQWVIGRLLWDPSLDADELIVEFCNGYFGAAGPYVVEAMRTLERARAAASDPFNLQRTSVGTRFLTWQVLHACDELMSRAAAAVPPNSLHASHLRTTRAVIDHPILLRGAQLSADAAAAGTTWQIDHDARLARQQAALSESGMVATNIYGTTPEQLVASYSIARTARTALPPACVGKDTNDYEILEDHSIWKYPSMARSVFDAKAADHGAARLEGGRETWGIQVGLCQLPTTGTWRVHLTVRADITAGADPTQPALAYGLYPTPRWPENQIEWVHPVSDLIDGEYHEIEIPLDVRYEPTGKYLYVTGRNPAVPWLYLDRIYFVRQ